MPHTLPRTLILAGAAAALAALTVPSGCATRRNVLPEELAATQGCPPWVEYPYRSHSDADSMYLGCSNALNLRNLVETPDDLVHGRTLGPASGTRESLAVGLYDQGKSPAAKSAAGATPTIIMPAAGGAANP